LHGLAVAVFVGASALGCAKKNGPLRPADSFGIADANVVVAVDFAGVVGTRFYSEFMKELERLPNSVGDDRKPFGDALKAVVGFDPAELRRVVVCANTDSRKFVVVAVSKTLVDRDAVIAALSKRGPGLKKLEPHAGFDLFAESEDDNDILAFPEANLAVAGSKDEVKEGIDRMKAGKAVALKGKLAAALGAAPKEAGLVAVTVPTPGLAPVIGMLRMPGGLKAAEKIAAVTVVARTAELLDVGVVVELKTDEDAEAFRDRAEAILVRTVKEDPLLNKDVMKPLKELLEGVTFGGAGSSVEIRLTVHPELARIAPVAAGWAVVKISGARVGIPSMFGAP